LSTNDTRVDEHALPRSPVQSRIQRIVSVAPTSVIAVAPSELVSTTREFSHYGPLWHRLTTVTYVFPIILNSHTHTHFLAVMSKQTYDSPQVTEYGSVEAITQEKANKSGLSADIFTDDTNGVIVGSLSEAS